MKSVTLLGCMLAFATGASALTIEGVYTMTEREGCDADQIDSVVIAEGANGEVHAYLSSYAFGWAYHSHLATWDGAQALSGASLPSSLQEASFAATFNADYSVLEGTVNAASCDGAWSFTAERVPVATVDPLTPLGMDPTIDRFLGTFEITTDWNEGRLRIVRLGDGRISANFGVEAMPRLLPFHATLLDTGDQALDLFHFDGEEIKVKWHLTYGTREGRLALQGYGISRSGRIYPVSGLATLP